MITTYLKRTWHLPQPALRRFPLLDRRSQKLGHASSAGPDAGFIICRDGGRSTAG